MDNSLFSMPEEKCDESLILGDAITEMKKLPSASVDLIFADPPYWMRVEGILHRVEGTEFAGCQDEWDNQFSSLEDYEQFTGAWLAECRRLLKPNGSFWVIGGMQCIYSIGAIMQRLGFWFINDVIWYKKNPTPNFKGTRLNNSHETLLWAVKDKSSKYTFNYKTGKELNTDTVSPEEHAQGVRKQMGSVWRFPVCSGSERLRNTSGDKLHSTQKPEELLYRIIALTSAPGDLVFDPFGGTMTTAAVAKRMGRKYLSIEQVPDYYFAGLQRVNLVIPYVGDIEKAIHDTPVQRVKMLDIIRAGYLNVGEEIHFSKASITARLMDNGMLNVDGQNASIHDAPGIARGNYMHVNGFEHCYVLREGIQKSLGEIREAYRKAYLSEKGVQVEDDN